MLTLLVQGFGKSLEIFTLTLLGSLPLGLLVMFGRRSRVAPLRWLVKLFISVMRGTPLMLQLMVVYYGPFLLFDFTPPGNWRFGAVIVEQGDPERVLGDPTQERTRRFLRSYQT